jgi:PKHD-type hydroxylase
MASLQRNNLKLDLSIGDVSQSGGGWAFATEHITDWCWNKGAFTDSELDTIIALGNQAHEHKAMTGAGLNEEYRNSRVSWLYPNEYTYWIYERLAGVVTSMNEQFFRFDLDGFFQGFQFTKYSAPGQHYDWHVDRGPNHGVRKLSISLQLSDPADYEGGELEIKLGKDEQSIERTRGMITLFPSFMLHRVTPVTEGTRYSLVAWVSGPPFK